MRSFSWMVLHLLLFFLFLLRLFSWLGGLLFFSWALRVLWSRGSLTPLSSWTQCGKGASSRQEGSPSSLTLTPVCLSCLLTLGMGWDNPGTGAKLVTSTYQSRTESCVHPLLTDLCSVLGVFGFLYFSRVFHILGPNVLLLKLCC